VFLQEDMSRSYISWIPYPWNSIHRNRRA